MSCMLKHRMKYWLGGFAALALAVGLAARSVDQNAWAKNDPSVVQEPTYSKADADRAITYARDLSVAFRAGADKVLPSVVAIETRPRVITQRTDDATPGDGRDLPRDPFNGRNPFEGTPWGDMFKGTPFGEGFRFEMPPMRPYGQQAGLGSGVIIDSRGLIMTNNHVVAGGGDVTVRLYDGREFPGSQVWTDPQTDIAIVKIDGAKNLVAAQLGDSDAVAIGQWVLALGQPFGLESTVTSGIISAKHRGIGIMDRENFLQTDAAINPGNSGGPLVNLEGEVIGINTAISSRSGGNEGIGFAIPINSAKWVANQLVKHGKVRRAYLGVGIQPVTQQLADRFQVQPREGVVVTEVFPNTPAAEAGLKSGDVIVEFARMKVASPPELQAAVERCEMGKSHKLTVVRDGKHVELTFAPQEQPENFGLARGESFSPSSPAESSQLEGWGLEVRPLDKAVAEKLGLEGVQGVVITDVRSGSPAEQAGLTAGMAIIEVNRQPVANGADVMAAIGEKAEDGILLLVRTAKGSQFVVIHG